MIRSCKQSELFLSKWKRDFIHFLLDKVGIIWYFSFRKKFCLEWLNKNENIRKVYEPISLLFYQILRLLNIKQRWRNEKIEVKLIIFSKFLLYYKFILIIIDTRLIKNIWSCEFSLNTKNERTISRFISNIFYYLSLPSMYEDLNAISILKFTIYYYYWM